ncbi:hypothetical protein TSOC_011879, partial [Tetrabaena socialis]
RARDEEGGYPLRARRAPGTPVERNGDPPNLLSPAC